MDIARGSVFECTANTSNIPKSRYIGAQKLEQLRTALVTISKMLSGLKRSLETKTANNETMNNERRTITYASSGVNIDASDQMEDLIYPHVASTFNPRVMELKGGFAGLFRLDYDERLFKRNYKNPVLVACTDGVGSKVLLASTMTDSTPSVSTSSR